MENEIECQSKVTLLVHDWCLGCSDAEEMWKSLQDEYGFSYEKVNASTDYGKHLIDKYEVSEVPTTIIDGSKEFEGVPEDAEAKEIVRQACEIEAV